MSFRTVPIGMAFAVANGATPKSSEEDLWDGDIPWLTPADLGKCATAELAVGARSITRKGLASCGTQIVPAGSIILSIRAPIGHTAIASEPLCFNQGCRGLVPSKKVLTQFGYWAILSAKPELQSAGQGTTFQELGRDKLRSIKIPLPDLATQRQIADFLDRETARIDLLIEKKQRLVALLGEKETGLIDSLFFYRDSKETTTWKRYRIPRVRDGFELRKLSYVCSLLRDGTHQPPARVDEGYPLLSVRNIVDGKFVLRSDDSKISGDDFHALCRSFEVKRGDVLLAVVGATLGKSAIVEEMPPFQIQRSLAIMRPLPDTLDGRYLLLFLRSGFFQDLLWSTTSFSAQPGVYLSSLGSFPVAVPKMSRQREIVLDFERMVTSLAKIKAKTSTSIDRLKEYRSALITAAVTGQIDVQTYARSGTTDRRLEAIQEGMKA